LRERLRSRHHCGPQTRYDRNRSHRACRHPASSGHRAGRECGELARPEPRDRTTRYDQGPVTAPPRRFSFCLSSRARVHIPVRIPLSAASSWPGTRQVLYSITKHAMRRSADEIGATSISFRSKVFSDPAPVVDGIFSAHRVCTTRKHALRALHRAVAAADAGANRSRGARAQANHNAAAQAPIQTQTETMNMIDHILVDKDKGVALSVDYDRGVITVNDVDYAFDFFY